MCLVVIAKIILSIENYGKTFEKFFLYYYLYMVFAC